ncbi:MAG: ABC transporter substrate-binding protein, partial [Pseudomonadota bacterium]|nr:ABC transporter substrate-binding protein [Pseudomonadota bacterium]
MCLILCFPALSARADPAPAISMHGTPAHAPGFGHFPYANPEAPKRGYVTLAVLGSFDSLNPL